MSYSPSLTFPALMDFDDLDAYVEHLPEPSGQHIMTPESSPVRSISSGPQLLPRIRPQDQTTEPAAGPQALFPTIHNTTYTNQYTNVNAHARRSVAFRRSASPLGQQSTYLVSPVSAQSSSSPAITCNVSPPSSIDYTRLLRPTLGHGRSYSTSIIPAYSRNTSTSSIDSATLDRYGYPTYRDMPTCVAQTPPSKMVTAYGHLTPISISKGPLRTPQSLTSSASRSRHASPSLIPSALSSELVHEAAGFAVETTTLLDYLTSANPTPSLVRQVGEPVKGQSMHFWYDVRNFRSWSEFSVHTIAAVPGLLKLLQCPLSSTDLSKPGRLNTSPETRSQLHDVCRLHHAVKVNSALGVALGQPHVMMRSLQPAPSKRPQPEFVSNYASDNEKTIYGEGRGRVVGIVRCYDEWNSGMRSESPARRVRYLQALADLHRFMREHGCRYGFVMTEIELVCVRYCSTADDMPIFGCLELAQPIQMATHGLKASASSDRPGMQMTALLALFYLHMLAKKDPLPGQHGWRLDAGPPAQLTRKRHLKERDSWMPKPNQTERREAKRNRGWVWPDEALSRKECGRTRRAKAG